jgi:hypothetical protein
MNIVPHHAAANAFRPGGKGPRCAAFGSPERLLVNAFREQPV